MNDMDYIPRQPNQQIDFCRLIYKGCPVTLAHYQINLIVSTMRERFSGDIFI